MKKILETILKIDIVDVYEDNQEKYIDFIGL